MSPNVIPEPVSTFKQRVGKHSQARGVSFEEYGQQKVVVKTYANHSLPLARTFAGCGAMDILVWTGLVAGRGSYVDADTFLGSRCVTGCLGRGMDPDTR